MFECVRCGARFDIPECRTEREYHDEVDAYETLYYYSCPECGCEDLEEV